LLHYFAAFVGKQAAWGDISRAHPPRQAKNAAGKPPASVCATSLALTAQTRLIISALV